ncbi:MAG: SDR family oxidoreductase [Acidimicrobiaceae bacterium]|nr:SDR family oxidoreductase [Acidimicrobiaceae bacterium]
MAIVLLVGGGGYLGSVLTEELLERGYAVRVLDRLYFGDRGLQGFRDRVQLVVSDMRVVPPEAFDGVDAVINVGGLSNDPTAEYNPRANYEMNTAATIAMANQCRERGVRRYVLASSCSVYDRGVGDDRLDVLLDEDSDVDPPGAYAGSKLQAERELLPMSSDKFCVTALRMGTLFGFSRRMRYDLVVNTFVKDALRHGKITVHFGGEMWRPLAEVRDAARAYIALLRSDTRSINGQVFNLVYRNYRISELALRVREALREVGVAVDVDADYGYRGVRSYRVTGQRLSRTIGFEPTLSVEDAVRTIVEKIREHHYDDFDNPRYYNISWMRLLEEAQSVIGVTGSVFDHPGPSLRPKPLSLEADQSS